MADNNSGFWRRCSSCKKELPFGSEYWVCSVSTCNRKRGSLVFCSVSCWDIHLPIMNHREAWAEERTAPSQQDAVAANSKETKAELSSAAKTQKNNADYEKEILVVASRVKEYIRAASGMNTSASALSALSDHIRRLSDAAIESARRSERKTVFDRDIPQEPKITKQNNIIRRRS